MISVTRPSRAIRMNPLGMKSRAACAPATSARPMRAGRLKLTSRPPPAAAPALRKVRRDRGCTAVEINSPNGFPQQDHTRYGGGWTDATSYRRNRRPLYLKLGIGLVTHRADDGTDVITSSAIGPQFGVG